jgi:hypothetical protein
MILIPMGVEASLREEHLAITDVLKPLTMLRGIQKATIRDAVPSDVDSDTEAHIHRRWKANMRVRSHLEGQAILHQNLISSMESNNPVELTFEMFSSLLRYAQAFERNDDFNLSIPAGSDNRYCHSRQKHVSPSVLDNVNNIPPMPSWRYRNVPLESSVQRAGRHLTETTLKS